MSKILVTGALGTIGRHLVPELRARQHEIWLLDLHHYHDDHYFRCDVGSFRQLERVFGAHEFDYVYHLAACASTRSRSRASTTSRATA